MPITYTILRDERLVKAYATDVIRADDLNGFVDALLADPDLTPGTRALYDASDADPDITILQLAEVASRVPKLASRGLGRIAILAQSRATYRVAKTFSVLLRALGIEVEVFTELHAAEAWLGLEDSSGSSDTGETPLPR
jgi:hypothetical protein